MIIRVFKAVVKDGMQQSFKIFFLKQALPLVKQQKGLMDVKVGLPINSKSTSFMMTTYWNDLESLKSFAGDNWEEAVIHDNEKDLLQETFVDHYIYYATENNR